MKVDFDVAIVGSGFAGSLMALSAAALGHGRAHRARTPSAVRHRRVVHAARQPAPRGTRGPLRPPEIGVFSKWGTWQRRSPMSPAASSAASPSTSTARRTFADDGTHERQLMVAASPHDEIADTHWYRPDFDHARARGRGAGAIYLDETALDGVDLEREARVSKARGAASAVRIDASFVVDASGPRGFLAARSASRSRRSAGCRRHRRSTRTSRDVARWDESCRPATRAAVSAG